MTAKPVEWALVIYYGSSAHRATYGRNVRDPQGSSKYTKDYIQLSQKADFIDTIKQIFPFAASVNDPIPLRYKWPTGSTTGALTWSADRHHLKWETSLGAPAPWKMTLTPSDASAETIPGIRLTQISRTPSRSSSCSPVGAPASHTSSPSSSVMSHPHFTSGCI
jgi:hypothetical protein